jgi:hypothetical protein
MIGIYMYRTGGMCVDKHGVVRDNTFQQESNDSDDGHPTLHTSEVRPLVDTVSVANIYMRPLVVDIISIWLVSGVL